MMGSAFSKNLVGISTATQRSPKGDFQTQGSSLAFGGGNNTYLFWAIPFPPGVSQASCILSFYTFGDWTSSTTVTVTAVDVPWDVNRLSLANEPAATGPSASLVVAGAAGSRKIDVDITALMTAVSGGRPWYGVKVSTASGARAMYGLGAQIGIIGTAFVPTVTTTWLDPLVTPTRLIPNIPTDNHRISDPSPTLGWFASDFKGPNSTDPTTMKFQVQIATDAAFTSVVYDTGMLIMPLVSRWDTSIDPTGPGGPFTATAGTSYWWRVKAQDATGQTSAWSVPAKFIYKAPPTITIVTPTPPDTHDPTPTIDWTFSGVSENQAVWGINVYDMSPPAPSLPGNGVGVYSSGLFSGTTSIFTMPPNYLWYGRQYRFDVVIFTDGNRVATADQPDYFVTPITLDLVYDGTVPPPDSLDVIPHANFPWVEVKWVYTDSVPDSFTIMRDGLPLITLINVTDYGTGTPNEYHYYDMPPNRTTHIWQVIATVSGLGSSDGTPGKTVEVHHNFSWLVSPDFQHYVMLGNLNAEKDVPGNTTVVEPLSGKPVVVLQGVSTERGLIKARVADDVVGISADAMLNHFYSIRDLYGGRAKLFLYNRILDVFIYDLVQYEKAFNEATVYDIEFNYIQSV